MRAAARGLLILTLGHAGLAGAAAQSLDVKPFVDTHYYDPLKAEPHAARIKILVPAWSNAFPDSLDNTSSRFAWQITLGREQIGRAHV